MIFFFLIETLLIGLPFLAYYIFKDYKNNRSFVIRLSLLVGFLGTGWLMNLSLRGDFLDLILPSCLYLLYCYLAFHILLIKTKFFKIAALIIAFPPVCVGYLMGTIGFFGVMMISMDLEPNAVVDLGHNTYYREYGYGNATTSDGGSKIDVYTYLPWFPIIEKKIYSKEISANNYETDNLRVRLIKTSRRFNCLVLK